MALCWLSVGCAAKEGESNTTLYVAVIFYGLSRIMLESASMHCRPYKAFQKLSLPLCFPFVARTIFSKYTFYTRHRH